MRKFCLSIIACMFFASCTVGMSGKTALAAETLAFGTAANTNTYYFVGAAIASLINKYVAGVECNVEVTSGVQENLTLLVKGEIQMGMSNSDVLARAYRGEGEFKGRDFSKIRILMGGHSTYHYFFTPASSGINELRDIKGKRLSLGVRGAAAIPFLEKLLEIAGVDVNKDTKHFYMTNGEQVAAMTDGKLDVGRCGSGIPAASIIEITNSMAVRFIDIPEAQVRELNKTYPALVPAVIPAGTYKGQDSVIHTMKGPSYIVVHESMPAELVVKILDLITSHNGELKKINVDAGEYNQENATLGVKQLGVPFHPAAESYWQKKGVL